MFNWRVIALQYCIGFCYKTTWTSHRYTYVPSLLVLPPPHPHLCCHGAPVVTDPPICAVKGPVSPLCCAAAPHWLFTPGPVRISALRSQSMLPLSFSTSSTVSSLCLSSALQMGSSVSFSRFYACALIYKIYFFSFWLTLCNSLWSSYFMSLDKYIMIHIYHSGYRVFSGPLKSSIP